MIKTGIYGASGYTGFELVKILTRHNKTDIVFATSETYAGKCLDFLYPTAPPVQLIKSADAPVDQIDVAFLCLPHAASAPIAMKALAAGARVVDLSADFRLKDADIYSEWYGIEHPAPEMLSEAVYGLTEFARDKLADAQLVAVPGCYPTSIALGLAPVLQAGLAHGTIIADSKSGVSGAGRTPKQNTHFVEAGNNFSPYKIGRNHRHLPEIEQTLKTFHPNAPKVIFSPHLLPVPRGIVSTMYVPLAEQGDIDAIYNLYQAQYANEPFVKVLPVGQLATLAHVVHTNRCVISLTVADDMLVIVSAEDNLLKGAAGQAVQNMNVMYSIEETEGLI